VLELFQLPDPKTCLRSCNPKSPDSRMGTRLEVKKYTRLISVIEFVFSANPSVEAQSALLLREALKQLPESHNVRRPSFRRDVVMAHGYKSQTDLAKDIFAFWQGDNTSLVEKMPQKHRARVEHLRSKMRKPKVRSFRDWFNSQNQTKLLNNMASALQRRYPMEEFDDCLSMVGMCVSRWLEEGNLDEKIEERGDMSVTLLNSWVRRRHLNTVNGRGKEPLFRMRGARTKEEKTSIWRDGNESGMHPDSVQASEWETAIAGCEDDAIFEFEVVSNNDSPEQEVSFTSELRILKNANAEAVEAAWPDASDRYLSVLNTLEDGGDRVDIASSERCSVARAGHLACRVRGVLRKTSELAPSVIEAIRQEPWITTEELAEDLELEEKQVRHTVAYLRSLKQVVSQGDSHRVR